MKILVCTDGSANSQKCIEVAAGLASRCSIPETAVIHVHEGTPALPQYWQGTYPFSSEEQKQLKKIDQRIMEERKKYFSTAEEIFGRAGLKIKPIFRVGHPAETITTVAAEEGYDLIVIGRRGRGGIKKLFLGSISSTVLQLAQTNVMIVK